MAKSITRLVLTGGPAAGKTTLISRILKEFKQEEGWRVITIPETATELISGFGIKPFGNCVSMVDFQYFVTSDQLHKEKMALAAAQLVPEEKVLIVYDRAVMDNKAYVSDEEFRAMLSRLGKTEDDIIASYDAVLHLVTCAKGAEFAYNFGNAARYESVEVAREKDDQALRAWSRHPNVRVIDNSFNFEDKIERAVAAIYGILGQSAPQADKRKYLISMPDCRSFMEKYNAADVEMMQTYLSSASPRLERRVRQQKNGRDYLYFYTEKRLADDGKQWVTERPISEKEYISYLMESDVGLHAVRKTKYRFNWDSRKMEIDIYPFSRDRAILFIYGNHTEDAAIPPELNILREVTGDMQYKNRTLAKTQTL
ncbi:MAG: AAA family ATPase [Candidatus Limivicinus sp.]|jgi:CYTH domain-containing protein